MILIFSPTLELHLQHFRTMLGLLLNHQLYAKRSKCVLGSPKVEYLGHIISGQSVSTDPTKAAAMAFSYIYQSFEGILRLNRLLQKVYLALWLNSYSTHYTF